MSSKGSISSTMGRSMHIVNALAYVLNFVFVMASNFKAYGPDNAEQSHKYPTLLTPADYAFGIWGVVYTAELIFAVYQLLPSVRNSQIITEGVSWWWVSVSFFQSVWVIAFSRDMIGLSAVLLTLIWISLVGLVGSLQRFRSNQIDKYGLTRRMSKMQYYLIHVPFSMHLGWVTAAAVLNWNIYAVAKYPGTSGASVQLTTAVLSLVFLAVAGVLCNFGSFRAEPTLTALLAWAVAAIDVQLSSPPKQVTDTFSSSSVLVLSMVRATLLVLLSALLLSTAYGVVRNYRTKALRDDVKISRKASKIA